MERIATFVFLCFLGATCALVGSGGCAHKQAPTPLPDLPRVEQGFQVTNCVTLVFDYPPGVELEKRLFDAGALTPMNGPPGGYTIFVFQSVDTQAKREAVNAALLSGAVMRKDVP